jgi:hypothetical protein
LLESRGDIRDEKRGGSRVKAAVIAVVATEVKMVEAHIRVEGRVCSNTVFAVPSAGGGAGIVDDQAGDVREQICISSKLMFQDFWDDNSVQNL